MGVFTEIFKELKNLPATPVLRERLLLLEEHVSRLAQKVIDLETENAQLKQEKSEIAVRLAEYSESDQFVEHRGALFKRKPEGGYHLAVYCPRCRVATSSYDIWPFTCSVCKWEANFKHDALDKIMSDLP